MVPNIVNQKVHKQQLDEIHIIISDDATTDRNWNITLKRHYNKAKDNLCRGGQRNINDSNNNNHGKTKKLNNLVHYKRFAEIDPQLSVRHLPNSEVMKSN